jgi:hypothetical protein
LNEDVQVYAGRGLTRSAMNFSESAMWVGDENGRIQILLARLRSEGWYSNMLYVLANQHGEMHLPRPSVVYRELALSQLQQPKPGR